MIKRKKEENREKEEEVEKKRTELSENMTIEDREGIRKERKKRQIRREKRRKKMANMSECREIWQRIEWTERQKERG